MSSNSKSIENIWYKDPQNFFLNVDNLTKFIPDSRMSLQEQLNAAFRFSIYFSVIVASIRQDVRVLFFAVFVGIFTYIVEFNEDKKKGVREALMQELNVKQNRMKKMCSLPTKQNPFMNVLMSDYSEFPNKPGACNINNRSVKKAIKESSLDVYQDVDDVFNRNASDRQFYTVPITTIPNQQGEFAHWLYNNGATCKEHTLACKTKY